MSNTKGTSEKLPSLNPADQVADFPPRNATTAEVRKWLRPLLEQRLFNDQEIKEYLLEVRLNGEDLHDLDLDEDYLFNIFPKISEEDYDSQKLQSWFSKAKKVDTMILEVSKRSEIDQQSTLFRKICCGILLVVIVACFIAWY
ncbi:uncharacterized protein PG986_001537 [Apiospora aurea]|uniref:Uncharacterized protein n=1 Tax=Apiospora aurea TaxID=335848 RepID=A0ABR1QYV4_9PEZI